MNNCKIIEPMFEMYLDSFKRKLSPQEKEVVREIFYTGVMACHTAMDHGQRFEEEALKVISQEVDEFFESQPRMNTTLRKGK
jgi:hypothetical protein